MANYRLDQENRTITWNTANKPMTGRIVSENEYGYLVETTDSMCVFISKYVPSPDKKP